MVLKSREWACTDQELNTVAKEMIQCGDTAGTGSVDLQVGRCTALFNADWAAHPTLLGVQQPAEKAPDAQNTPQLLSLSDCRIE